MRTVSKNKLKKLRQDKRIYSVTDPVTNKPKQPEPEPEPKVPDKFESLVVFLKTLTTFLTKIKKTIDAVYEYQVKLKNEFGKNKDHQDSIKRELETKIQLLNTDDSAHEWDFHFERDSAGRLKSPIKVKRIE